MRVYKAWMAGLWTLRKVEIDQYELTHGDGSIITIGKGDAEVIYDILGFFLKEE